MRMANVQEYAVPDSNCERCLKIPDQKRLDCNPPGFLAYRCDECRTYVCLDCTDGTFSEIHPCREGHKCEFIEEPE